MKSKSPTISIISLKDIFQNPVEERRMQEYLDGKRVNEDHNAIANLSEKEIHQSFRIGMQVERLKNPANED